MLIKRQQPLDESSPLDCHWKPEKNQREAMTKDDGNYINFVIYTNNHFLRRIVAAFQTAVRQRVSGNRQQTGPCARTPRDLSRHLLVWSQGHFSTTPGEHCSAGNFSGRSWG